MHRNWYAAKALRNAMTRAARHLVRNNPLQAVETLESGCRTARLWLTGTHPRQDVAS